jgi:hypothetical protein
LDYEDSASGKLDFLILCKIQRADPCYIISIDKNVIVAITPVGISPSLEKQADGRHC